MIDKKKHPRLVWINTETTGLHPEAGYLLEVACVITDRELNPYAEFASLVAPHWATRDAYSEHGGIYEAADHYVRAMHTKNGLWAAERKNQDVQPSRDLSAGKVSTRLDTFVRKHTEGQRNALHGSSVGFDRIWLDTKMPGLLDACVSYRNVDVSTLLELAECWAPDLVPPKKEGNHRALGGIKDSIRRLRYYRENLFREEY
jgi:oligoribonuclease